MPKSSPDRFQVGPVCAAPGERSEGYLPVGELADGTPLRVPVALIHGARPGKTLYVQAVSDGDELNGLAVAREVLRQVHPEDLCGRLIVVPVANVPAFLAHEHASPLDGKKLNRCFPGKRDGSISERIAYALFQEAVLQADLCLDLHQGGVRPMIDEVRVRVGPGGPLYAECLELARVFGIGYILDERGPSGQLARAAPARGIPAIDPELGGCHGWDAQSIAKGVRGVFNVLRYYGFLAGEPELPPRQYVVQRFVTLRPNHGGLIDWHARLYDEVRRGDLLATITDVFGRPRERIVAPVGGIFWSQAVYPTVAAGEAIGTLGASPVALE